MDLKEFISLADNEKIVAAIKEAELNTSGEIRVHIESTCKSNPYDRAVYIFNYLKMYKTVARNGVLIYVAVKSQKFAIIGDEGINNAVPDDFWDKIKAKMASDFCRQHYAEGLKTAILTAGESLKRYFPYKSDDINEQPDEISLGK